MRIALNLKNTAISPIDEQEIVRVLYSIWAFPCDAILTHSMPTQQFQPVGFRLGVVLFLFFSQYFIDGIILDTIDRESAELW